MYKSPIEVITSQMYDAIKQMREQQEEHILQAVFNVGVNVDKDELIRALQYDREQYTKGYADGAKELVERVKAVYTNDKRYDRPDAHTLLYTLFANLDNVLEEMGVS